MLPIDESTIRLFLHVLAATIWVGGQLTLGSIIPALRPRADDPDPEAAAYPDPGGRPTVPGRRLDGFRCPARNRRVEPRRAARRRLRPGLDHDPVGQARLRGDVRWRRRRPHPRCGAEGAGRHRRGVPTEGRGVLGRVRGRVRTLRGDLRCSSASCSPADRRDSAQCTSSLAASKSDCRDFITSSLSATRSDRLPVSRRRAGKSACRPASTPGAAAAASCRSRGSPRSRRSRRERSGSPT